MSRVIFDDGSLNAIDFAGEPVLYLMAHDPQSYIQFLQSKIFNEPVNNGILYQKTLQALEDLHSSVLNNLSLDITSRHSFRREFKNSVLIIRSVVRKR